jgi:hypothetical protein
MALAQRADLFKVAVSGAPVSCWEAYDTAYTERYWPYACVRACLSEVFFCFVEPFVTTHLLRISRLFLLIFIYPLFFIGSHPRPRYMDPKDKDAYAKGSVLNVASQFPDEYVLAIFLLFRPVFFLGPALSVPFVSTRQLHPFPGFVHFFLILLSFLFLTFYSLLFLLLLQLLLFGQARPPADCARAD